MDTGRGFTRITQIHAGRGLRGSLRWARDADSRGSLRSTRDADSRGSLRWTRDADYADHADERERGMRLDHLRRTRTRIHMGPLALDLARYIVRYIFCYISYELS
jgi:hypothetical protein